MLAVNKKGRNGKRRSIKSIWKNVYRECER